MDESERQALDHAFIEWYRTSSIHQGSPRGIAGEAPGVSVTKNSMRWRYLTARIVLHRPVLLWYAMRKMNPDHLSDDKRTAIDICRDVTAELIADIVSTWRAHKECAIAAWNATWMLYQAVMVPLLSLFSDPMDPGVTDKSRRQVERTMNALAELQQWSPTAKRSLEVVSRIYEASQRHSPEPTEQSDYYANNMDTPVTLPSNTRPSFIDVQYANIHGSPQTLSTSGQETYANNMLDTLNWSTGWQKHDYPFETPRLGWDYNAMNGWGAQADAEFDGYFNSVFSAAEQAQITIETPYNMMTPVSQYPYQ